MTPSTNLIRLSIGKNESLDKALSDKKLKDFFVVKMEQTHSSDFAEVSKKDFPPDSKTITIPKVDAVITTQKNILLSVKSADCLSILIHWKKVIENNQPTEIIAAIHSGRAGTEKKILTKVLIHLKNKYGVDENSGELTIWLGPTICKKCYQINRETDLHYDIYQKNIEQIGQVFPKFKSLSCDNPTNIKIIRSPYCTFHNNDLFYSYRKFGKGVKMNYSLVGMK